MNSFSWFVVYLYQCAALKALSGLNIYLSIAAVFAFFSIFSWVIIIIVIIYTL